MLVWTVGLWMDPRWSVSNLWDSVIISPIWADLYRLSNIQRLLIISEQINTLNHVLQLAEFQVSDSSSPSWPRNTSLQTIFLLLFSSCTRLNSSSETNFSYVFPTWTCDASKYQTSFFFHELLDSASLTMFTAKDFYCIVFFLVCLPSTVSSDHLVFSITPNFRFIIIPPNLLFQPPIHPSSRVPERSIRHTIILLKF